MFDSPLPNRSKAWLGLCSILLVVLLVAMDGSVLYLAMPRLSAALSPTAEQSLWMLDSYGLVVGSLLIAFGNLGDRYGRLRLMMAGALLFGLASLGAAMVNTPLQLIICRALMGVGGATLLPSGLAIVSELFPDPRQRAQAIGLFAATFAAGFALGPLIGGMLLQHFAWGAVFLINLPVVLAFLLLAPWLLREVRQGGQTRLDGASLVLSFVGILLFIYALKSTAAEGLALVPTVCGVLGALALVMFLRRQTRLAMPLLDVALFRDRRFALAIVTGLLSLVVWSASGYLGGVYLQAVLGHDVFTAALLTLPGAAVLTLSCVGSARIVERVGHKAALVATHVLIGAGALLLLLVRADGGVGVWIASGMIAGIGYGLSFSLVADIAVSAVPSERAGAAGSIAETSNELGNALGIALLGSLAALVFRLQGPGKAGTLSETLAYAGLNDVQAWQAKVAFVQGLHWAMAVGGVVTLGVAVLAWRWLPRNLGR
ncbi:permease [Pseudomonas cremoricolorata]|uniref:Permease n=1 Tax=Pseudomonas cremoricolorata TaxID=157783 RepID=A0A089WFS5_9PSED|nr:permease [Pseudomonas cremoricolorata]